MILQFPIQDRLNGDLGQYLTEFVEVFFRFGVLCRRSCDGFAFSFAIGGLAVFYVDPTFLRVPRFERSNLGDLRARQAQYFNVDGGHIVLHNILLFGKNCLMLEFY